MRPQALPALLILLALAGLLLGPLAFAQTLPDPAPVGDLTLVPSSQTVELYDLKDAGGEAVWEVEYRTAVGGSSRLLLRRLSDNRTWRVEDVDAWTSADMAVVGGVIEQFREK